METMDVTLGSFASAGSAHRCGVADSIPVRETGFFGYEVVGSV